MNYHLKQVPTPKSSFQLREIATRVRCDDGRKTAGVIAAPQTPKPPTIAAKLSRRRDHDAGDPAPPAVLHPRPIPEPATLALLGIGLAGLALRRRR